MSVPMCIVPCSRVEVEGFGRESAPNIRDADVIQVINCYANSDCWAVTSGRDGHVILHYEMWSWYNRFGNCHGPTSHRFFFRAEDPGRWDIGDYIDIYLYGANTKKVRFLKMDLGLWTRQYFGTPTMLEP